MIRLLCVLSFSFLLGTFSQLNLALASPNPDSLDLPGPETTMPNDMSETSTDEDDNQGALYNEEDEASVNKETLN